MPRLVVLLLAAVYAVDAQLNCNYWPQSFCNKEQCASHKTIKESCCRCYNDCCETGDLLEDTPGTCTDRDGKVHQSQDRWPDNNKHPCVTYICLDGKIQTSTNISIHCQQPPARGYQCTKHRAPGQCCYTHKCISQPIPEPDVCIDTRDQLRQNGAVWTYPEDPCTEYKCVRGNIEVQSVGCPLPPPGCKPLPPDPDQCCGECFSDPLGGCFDRFNTARKHGDTWKYPNEPCIINTCANSQITSTKVICESNKPSHYCNAVPAAQGECCPTYECYCVDPHGGVHTDGSTWFSPVNPCSTYTCNGGVISYRKQICPKPTPGCTLVPSTGVQCCPQYDCSSDCRDRNNETRKHGDTWKYPNEDCTEYTCFNGEISQTVIDCPELGSDCAPLVIMDECCPVCGPKPCTDERGQVYDHGTTWIHSRDPCLNLTCVNGEIQTARTFCPLTPDCRPGEIPPGQCCHIDEICDADPTSCTDRTGVIRQHGATWTIPSRPCEHNTCRNGEIFTAIQDCARPPPGCTIKPWTCCEYICPKTCNYRGTTYFHGDEIVDNPQHPCSKKTCDNGAVVELEPTIVCDPVDHCDNVIWPEGECCRQCASTDTTGGITEAIRLLLEEIRQYILRLAKQFNIDAQQIQVLQLLYSSSVTKITSLLQGLSVEEGVKGCVGDAISILELLGIPNSNTGSPTDDLEDLLRILREMLIRTLARARLVLGLSNQQVTVINNLIEELIRWFQVFNYQDVYGSIRLVLKDVLSIFTALFEISGCVDDVGIVHLTNELYPNDYDNPTLCYVCKEGIPPTAMAILNITEHCAPVPSECSPEYTSNSCCADAKCNNPICIYNGVRYSHGEIWKDNIKRPCVTFTCDRGQVKEVDRVECPPTPPGCNDLFTDGVCCPTFNCDERPCQYNQTQYDNGVSWPADPVKPCTIFTCNGGIISTEDRSGDCEGPPQPFCQERPIHYQCCPAYDCVSVNCTYDGRTYSVGETWVDDDRYPCKTFICTTRGISKASDLSGDCPARPEPSCVGEREIGECCKTWNCPVDDSCVYRGIRYEHNQIWWDNPQRRCIQYKCIRGLLIQLQNQLPCPTVPSSCVPSFNGTQCCHYKYTCEQCMYDPLGNPYTS